MSWLTKMAIGVDSEMFGLVEKFSFVLFSSCLFSSRKHFFKLFVTLFIFESVFPKTLKSMGYYLVILLDAMFHKNMHKNQRNPISFFLLMIFLLINFNPLGKYFVTKMVF